ncbi:radical SAM protein [Methylomonas sp. YC3]
MNDRILFVVPPPIRYVDYINPAYNTKSHQKNDGIFGNVVTDMPLGCLALSAYVKAHVPVICKLIDFSIELNKLNSFDFDSFDSFFYHFLSQPPVSNFNPTVIAISALFTPSYQNLIDIARSCRRIFPDAYLLAGGGVPQNTYKEIYATFQGIDGICYGEGERPFLNFLQAACRKTYLEQSSSWITLRKTQGVVFSHDFIENLDEIPFYDYDLCDVKEYSKNPAITSYASLGIPTANFHVMTSRGCPFKCTFCASHTVHGRKMRYYSVERIREDFWHLRNQYGAKQFIFQDDHLMGDTDRVFEILQILEEMGDATPVFQNGLALYALDKKMLEALKRSGVVQLTLPVESGSHHVLKKLMKKPLNLDIAVRVVNDCRELNIYTNVNILVGMPGETREDIDEARKFLTKLNCNWFVIVFATPLVGSEMLEVCIENDYLQGSYIDTDYKKAIVATPEFSTSEIYKTAYFMNLELNFINNPDYRLGNYQQAIIGLHGAIKAKNDHVFAHYFSGLCYEQMGQNAMARNHFDKAKSYLEESSVWQEYADIFGIKEQVFLS